MKPSHQPGEPDDPAAGLGIVNKDGPWDSLNSTIYSRLSAPGLEAYALHPSIVRTNSGTGKLSLEVTISWSGFGLDPNQTASNVWSITNVIRTMYKVRVNWLWAGVKESLTICAWIKGMNVVILCGADWDILLQIFCFSRFFFFEPSTLLEG